MLTISVGHSGAASGLDDVHFATMLAGRVALALDNAGLFSDLERSERERAEIAETLQRGLLPPPLPHIPGWSVAAIYRPAGAENEIGGDFYDAFRIAGGWMVVIGDVTGRGAQAAAVTAHARYTLRTAAALTGDPVVALRDAQPRAARPPGHGPLQRRRDGVLRRPGRAGAPCGRRPPAAAAGRWRPGHRGRPSPAPVLGAFTDATGRSSRPTSLPASSWSSSPTASPRRAAEASASARSACGPSWPGVGSPALAAQQIEGALHEFTGGTLDDDAAILAIAPAAAGIELASDRERELVERLYEAFNRRDPDGDRRRSATRGWASSRSAPPKKSAAPRPTSGRGACTNTSSTSTAPGTSC